MIYTHCTVHRLELSILDSMKFDDYLTLFDENIHNIFKFYYKNATRRFLKKPTNRRVPDINNTSEGFQEHFSEKFHKTVQAGQDYLDDHFVDFNKTPSYDMFKIFNTKKWSSLFHGSKSKRTWGKGEITSMAKYNGEYGFVTYKKKEMAVKQWPLICQKVIQLNHPTKSDLEIYVDILASTDGTSTSTASGEKGFSSMSNEKTFLRTCFTTETLDDVLKININRTDY